MEAFFSICVFLFFFGGGGGGVHGTLYYKREVKMFECIQLKCHRMITLEQML